MRTKQELQEEIDLLESQLVDLRKRYREASPGYQKLIAAAGILKKNKIERLKKRIEILDKQQPLVLE